LTFGQFIQLLIKIEKKHDYGDESSNNDYYLSCVTIYNFLIINS